MNITHRNNSEGLFVFCCPGNAYTECHERDAIESRTRLNESFDKLVTFSPDYAKFSAIPDVVRRSGEKCKRQRILQAFLQQDLTKIGNRELPRQMSNYLFHLTNPIVPGWESPDLDAVFINGQGAEDMAQIIESFYQSFRWDAAISNERVSRETIVLRQQSRLYEPTSTRTVTIFNPYSLITTAQKAVCYDPNNLYWRVQ